jgi:AcrR family transcriptional regulator
MPISSILRARRQKEKEALKKKILNVAKKIAVKEGWQAVTIRRIAGEIHYSLPVIYSHFKDKAEIIFLIAQEGYEKLMEELNTAVDQGQANVKDELLNYCSAYYEFGLSNPAIYHAMFGENYTTPNLDNEVQASHSEQVYNFLVDKIRPQTEAARNCLELIWANMHGLVSLSHLNKVSPTKINDEGYLSKLVDAYSPSLGANQALGGSNA